MIKFISKTFWLILLPVLTVLVVGELMMRQIPNDYSYKNNWLENNASSVEILSLGSSHGFFGINPKFFDEPAFNAAHVSQSLDFDRFIFNKFFNQMDSLKYVIIPISYFTPLGKIENGSENWRINSYQIYYDCDYYGYVPKYNIEITKNLTSNIKRIFKYVFAGKTSLSVNELGFGLDYNSTIVNDLETTAVDAAKRHTYPVIDGHLLEENSEYLADIIAKCESRGIKVVLLTTPTTSFYSDNLNKQQLDCKVEFCEYFERSFSNVVYLDMTEDERFVNEDFHDGDHLNDIGAMKLSVILNKKIKNGDFTL